jgi:hypothetical protein
MPILKRVIAHGGSRGVTLPASWLALVEMQTGEPVKEVLMEVNGDITIKPIPTKKLEGAKNEGLPLA